MKDNTWKKHTKKIQELCEQGYNDVQISKILNLQKHHITNYRKYNLELNGLNPNRLSIRDKQVIKLLDGKHSLQDIADIIGISKHTVRGIRTKLLQKGVITRNKYNNYRKLYKKPGTPNNALKKYWAERKKEKNKSNPDGFYTKEEDHSIVLLRDKYHFPFKDIGEYVGRSGASVGGRYAYIKKHNPSPLSKEEIEELDKYCNQKSSLEGAE